MPTALVTGASAGIGHALALGFAARGYDLILTARRRDRLEALAAAIGPKTRIVEADLNDPAAPARLFAETGPVDLLVNNAGLGAAGAFADSDLARQMEIVQVNIASLTALTHLYLAPMRHTRHGRILNVASTAAFQPGPMFAVYCASKAYVLSFSEALHSELSSSGITVTALCPGATISEFADVAGLSGSRLFRHAMTAEAVAKVGVDATLSGKRLAVAGLANSIGATGVRFVPRAAVLSIAKRLMSSVSA